MKTTFIKKHIEIGDSKQEKFYPQFKTKHWDNEANMSIRLVDDFKGKHKEVGDKIEYENGNIKAGLYEIDDDNFEFDVTFLEKPKSNVVEFTVQSKEFDFFYQPELTDEEKDRGMRRPENVIGSYAVYHKTKKNNQYKTGKAFHIYRPYAEDANGVKEWCELKIENNILSVTVPKKFLKDAQYPVRVDPTFGYTSAGATPTTLQEGYTDTEFQIGTNYPLSEDGTIDSMSVYLGGDIATLKGLVYREDSNGANSHDLVASATSVLNDFGTAWYDITFASESLVTDDYILAASQSETSAGSSAEVTMYYDSTGSDRYYISSGISNANNPNPWNKTEDGTGRKYSIYATYTAGGGGGGANTTGFFF
jgi:hypothetical protein